MASTESPNNRSLTFLGFVSGEGGPLLLADARVAQAWRGVDDGDDYERAIAIFDDDLSAQGGMIAVFNQSAVLWEMSGAGTARLFIDSDGNISLSRAWLSSNHDEAALVALASMPLTSPTQFATLEITSGVLAVMWAPENGSCIETHDINQRRRPSGSTSVANSCLLIPVSIGTYVCLHDEIRRPRDSARRCHIVPISAGSQ